MIQSKKLKKIVSVLLVALTLGSITTTQTASAAASGSIVHDPLHTMQSALNTAQLIQAEITRVKDYIMKFNQLRSMMDINTWKKMYEQDVARMQNYIKSLKNVEGDVNSNTSRLRQRLDEATQSNLSFAEYAKLEAQRVSQGKADAIRRQQNDIDDLDRTAQDYEDMKKWENQLSSDITDKDSSIMMNQQLNKLITQNAEIKKAMLATRMDNRSDALAKEAADRNIAAVLRKAKADRDKQLTDTYTKDRNSILGNSPKN